MGTLKIFSKVKRVEPSDTLLPKCEGVPKLYRKRRGTFGQPTGEFAPAPLTVAS